MNNDNYQKAKQFYLQGDFSQALQCFEHLLKESPKDIELLNIVASLSAQLNKLDAALSHIERAIEISPKESALHNTLGNILLKQKKFPQAETAYKEAITLNPSSASAHNNLGHCLYQQGQLSQAIEHYAQAITLKPDYVDALYNQGIAYAKLGELANAEQCLCKVVQQTPQHAPALGQLAEVYRLQGKLPQAVDSFQKRIEIQPQHVESYHSLGQTFLQLGKSREAVVAFEQTLALNDKHTEVYQDLAQAYLADGDSSKALNYFFRQLENQPTALSYYNIGSLLAQQQRHKDAIDYFKKSVELEPSYLPTYLNLGALYLKTHQTGLAISAYEDALTLKPNDSEIQHIITALSQADSPDAAPEQYIKNLFDQYAQYYDKHLTECLSYHVPEAIRRMVEVDLDIQKNSVVILDLGCGTGLTGTQIKPFARKLIGIDLSAQMIDLAQQKQVYDELAPLDVKEALKRYLHNDLVIAGDVFSYIGKLDEIFSLCHDALNDKGYFIFSVESGDKEPYTLQQTIRYAHHKNYLQQLAKDHHFHIVSLNNIVLRQQQRKPVSGYLMCLQKG